MSKLHEAITLASKGNRAGKQISAANMEKLSGFASRATDSATSAQTLADELVAFIAELEAPKEGSNAATAEQRAVLDALGSEYATPDRVRELVRAARDGKEARDALIARAVTTKTAIRGNRMTTEEQEKYRIKLGKLDYSEIADEVADLERENGTTAFRSRIIRAVGPEDDDEDEDEDEGRAGVRGEPVAWAN